MDTEVGVDLLNKAEKLSTMEKLDENIVAVEAKDNNVELPQSSATASDIAPSIGPITPEPQPSATASDIAPSIGPITPDSNRETGDFPLDFTSPLTLVSSPRRAICFDSHSNDKLCLSIDCSPHTPMEGVFDPFAPGPDKLMQAPYCKKYLEESRRNVTRRLDFNSSVNFSQDGNYETEAETISDDEILLEAVYDTLLEAIVSKQTEGILAEILPLDPGSDGFNTPISVPRLSGIAETCPGAPVKPVRKLRTIDRDLCRKLEF